MQYETKACVCHINLYSETEFSSHINKLEEINMIFASEFRYSF